MQRVVATLVQAGASESGSTRLRTAQDCLELPEPADCMVRHMCTATMLATATMKLLRSVRPAFRGRFGLTSIASYALLLGRRPFVCQVVGCCSCGVLQLYLL